ncbi:hypothetical protein [Microbacterium sp. H6]|uniref:hypothetical protein n=1 Tax=Microbacterium sp. H6 TaxID=421122 RepID=UPI000DE4F164|nr:hypothetical protein [Microbacterium sp. H6]RBO73519.1 hypothetical protein DSP71_05015 [Microbacterium sp. H6]
MGYYDAAKAVQDRVLSDGLGEAEIETLHAELPGRKERSEDERAVAFGLSLAFSELYRARIATMGTAEIIAEHQTLTDDGAFYIDPETKLNAERSNVIESELERRYPGSDQFGAFEQSGGDTENGAGYLAHWGAYWTAKMHGE